MNLLKTLTPMSALRAAALVLTAGALASQNSRAQIIYSQTFNTDDSANWAVNYSDVNGPANSSVNFNFDYTTAGIPIAPHSSEFGSSSVHHGLKMTPNYATGGGLIGTAAVPGVSVSPTAFSISANFVMHADMWVNVNCTPYAGPPAGLATSAHNGSSSSVLYGCGYGTAGTEAVVAGQCDCVWVGTCADNGSSAQMRMYGPSQTGSYQSGAYQGNGTLSPAYPGDPYVYNQAAGSRTFYNDSYWSTIFPSVQVPDAQTNVQPHQTWNKSLPGLIDFKWHDVSVQKIGNVIVYSIDGNIVATGNETSAGTPAGSLLIFNAADINSGASTDPNYTNVNFVVFANIVVSNYANVVNITVPTPNTSEATPGSPGQFTLTRSSAGVPLTVNYTLTGTATNGIQYQTLPTSVTFASTALSTNINIVPIDDGIPNPTTTVILTIQPGTGYAGAGSGIVNILDADPATVDISCNSQAYGRYTNSSGAYYDYISYNVTRRGNLSIGHDLTVNLAYSGSAVGGTDYTPVSSITIPDGSAIPTALNLNNAAGLQIVPLDNPSVTTNRTVIVSVTSGSGYAIGNGPATGTIVSAHYPAPVAVLLSDLLTDNSALETNNWKLTYGCGDLTNDPTDFEADFGMTLAGGTPGGLTIPPPPNGNPTALHLTCNKDISPGSGGAVNAYYTNLWLNGNYAVRFNMNLIEGQTTAANTEGVMFGINHTGTCSNWWYGSGPLGTNTFTSDGIWYYITAQPAGSVAGDYQEYTGLGGTNGNTGWQRLTTQSQSSYGQAFKDHPGPFTTLDGFGNQTAGVPANGSPVFSYDDSNWSDVEIKQLNNVVTMSINHTAIFVYTNTTVWTNGYLMLGYSDPYGSSMGSSDAGAYFANLQVVQLPVPTVVTINSIVISSGNVVIKFTTSSATDTTASFTLQSSGTVNGTYNNVSPVATITSLGSNQFQATVTYGGGGNQFYRILHN